MTAATALRPTIEDPDGLRPVTPAPSGRRARSPLFAFALFVLLFVVDIAVLLRMSPRLFWVDDAMSQYSPAMWWLGHNRRALMPPLMNPELGGAASFATDMQYGVLDPLHWLWDAVAATFSDMQAFSAVYGGVCLFIAGSGVLVQLLLRRVPAVLAASVAIGVSTSGFLLWFGSDWWPLMWSAGWICWIWNGLRMRSWQGLLVLGASTAAFFAAGYPYFLSFAVILVAAHLLEVSLAARSPRVLIERAQLLRYTAMAGGLLYALPTLTTMLQSAPLTTRPLPDALLGNSGLAVPNVIDAVLGSATLLGDTGFPGPGLWTVTYSFIITVPLVALIDWRRFLEVGGALTGAVVSCAALGATQLPSVVFGFRNPFIYLTMFEIFLPITLIVLVVHARRITRRRVIVSAAIVLAQALLTVMRAPNFFVWSLIALAVLGAALLAVVLHLSRRSRVVAAVGVAALSITPPIMAMGLLISVQDASNALQGFVPPPAGVEQPIRLVPGRTIDPPLVRTFAERSLAPGASASVYDFRNQDIDTAFASGALAGNENLFANSSLGYGYGASVSQADRSKHDCRAQFGTACSPEALLARVPSGLGDQRWIDVLSQPAVIVNADAPKDVVTYLRRHWRQTAGPSGWLRFEKRNALPGRITVARDVQVATSGWRTDLGRVGTPMDSYTVSTAGRPGSLVFYTTWWPGLEATIDGRSTPVTSLDGSILRIDLPSGLQDARLEVTYAPIGSKLLGLTVVGPILVLLAAAVSLVAARRRTRSLPEAA